MFNCYQEDLQSDTTDELLKDDTSIADITKKCAAAKVFPLFKTLFNCTINDIFIRRLHYKILPIRFTIPTVQRKLMLQRYITHTYHYMLIFSQKTPSTSTATSAKSNTTTTATKTTSNSTGQKTTKTKGKVIPAHNLFLH